MPEGGKDLRALIVDRNADDCAHLQAALEKTGWVCDVVNDAESALSILGQMSCRGVFMDVFLPRMNGEELLLEVRRSRPGLPVVITSLEDNELIIERFLRLGAFAYLVKPVADKEIRKVTAVIRGMQIVNVPVEYGMVSEENDHFMLVRSLLQHKECGTALGTTSEPCS